MRDNNQENTLTRVKRRGSWQVSRELSGNDETVNQLTLFIIGAAAFFAGFWALACLLNAFLQVGPLKILKQLSAAITGL